MRRRHQIILPFHESSMLIILWRCSSIRLVMCHRLCLPSDWVLWWLCCCEIILKWDLRSELRWFWIVTLGASLALVRKPVAIVVLLILQSLFARPKWFRFGSETCCRLILNNVRLHFAAWWLLQLVWVSRKIAPIVLVAKKDIPSVLC